jgi:hypothetical protein
MQVEELLKPFPLKEFHPFPRALIGPGAHEMLGPEALKLGFRKVLVMTSGLRGTNIVPKIVDSLKYHGLEVVLYDQVESNPKDYNVMDAVARSTNTKAAGSPSKTHETVRDHAETPLRRTGMITNGFRGVAQRLARARLSSGSCCSVGLPSR